MKGYVRRLQIASVFILSLVHQNASCDGYPPTRLFINIFRAGHKNYAGEPQSMTEIYVKKPNDPIVNVMWLKQDADFTAVVLRCPENVNQTLNMRVRVSSLPDGSGGERAVNFHPKLETNVITRCLYETIPIGLSLPPPGKLQPGMNITVDFQQFVGNNEFVTIGAVRFLITCGGFKRWNEGEKQCKMNSFYGLYALMLLPVSILIVAIINGVNRRRHAAPNRIL